MDQDQLIEALSQAVQRSGTLNVLFTHAIAEQIGLSATEFEFLDVLRHQGPLTAGQLSAACGLSTGGVTGMVDRLEKAGFAKRVPDPKDRRKVIVESVPWPPDLLAKVGHLYDPVSAGFSEVVSHYSNAELEVILDFITRSSRMIEQVGADFTKN